jgi:demethylmenaquinone methyltransferase/2-methoxy-6-polyprenyl-1,4-benzoquinol methylase
MDSDNNTYFGFRTVAENEKTHLVRQVFSSVARRYDVMNDLMSMGIHHLWKDAMVNMLPAHGKLLDVAGGTGDIAARYLKKTAYEEPVTVCDINQEMLLAGRDRAIDRNQAVSIKWVCGDAEKLPFEDHSFDAYSIAFGIRNVTHIDQALAEAYRVLRPGGKFVCLEFSHVTSSMLAKLYDAYSFHVIPKIGQLVTGDGGAYQYLVESIRKFPSQQRFAEMLKEAGFSGVNYRNMSVGATALHYGWRN